MPEHKALLPLSILFLVVLFSIIFLSLGTVLPIQVVLHARRAHAVPLVTAVAVSRVCVCLCALLSQLILGSLAAFTFCNPAPLPFLFREVCW